MRSIELFPPGVTLQNPISRQQDLIEPKPLDSDLSDVPRRAPGHCLVGSGREEGTLMVIADW